MVQSTHNKIDSYSQKILLKVSKLLSNSEEKRYDKSRIGNTWSTIQNLGELIEA